MSDRGKFVFEHDIEEQTRLLKEINSSKNNIRRKKILYGGACVIAAFGTFSLVFGSLSASHVSFALLSTLKLALLVGFMSNPVGWIVLGCVTLVGLAGLCYLYNNPEKLTSCITANRSSNQKNNQINAF